MTEITQELMDEKLTEIRTTTNLINTPEPDIKFGIKGTFYLYSTGMKDNYDLPDLEMRGIPGNEKCEIQKRKKTRMRFARMNNKKSKHLEITCLACEKNVYGCEKQCMERNVILKKCLKSRKNENRRMMKNCIFSKARMTSTVYATNGII